MKKLILILTAAAMLSACTADNCVRALRGLSTAPAITDALIAQGTAVEIATKVALGLSLGQLGISAACASV